MFGFDCPSNERIKTLNYIQFQTIRMFRFSSSCYCFVSTPTGDRVFVCAQSGCRRTFCRNEELTRHLRIHSGNRPYLCQVLYSKCIVASDRFHPKWWNIGKGYARIPSVLCSRRFHEIPIQANSNFQSCCRQTTMIVCVHLSVRLFFRTLLRSYGV